MDFLYDLWDTIQLNLISQDRWLFVLKGLLVTLRISLFSIMISTVLGTILSFMRLSKIRIIKWIANAYVNIIRGTPVVTQLLLIYFGILATADISKEMVAVITFSLNSAAYVAVIIGAGINAVDRGQMEAGRSLGLNYTQTMFKIILPQAVKKMLPTYTSEFIVLIKETAVVGYIAIEDLTKVCDIIRSDTFEPLFTFIVAALLYFIVTTLLAKLFGIMERRLAKSDRS